MPMIHPLIQLLLTLLQLYGYVLWAWLIISWLISFNIINRYQPAVKRIDFALFKLTDPVLKPIRRHMPDLGSIDISPIVLILLLNFLQQTLLYYALN